MKASDYVIDFLARNDLTEIFTVSGGGIAHLLDSIGQNPAVSYYCNYHEQACAIAAEGYARITGKAGVCLVTIGPGAVNALAGIVGAWYDSLPLIVFSGQVRSDLIADYSKVRQKGPQEGNVIEMARPVTKYVVSVRDPRRIRFELEKAFYLATSGRPGPVWIEIPFDVQGATIDETTLEGFTPEEDASVDTSEADAACILKAIEASRCPLLIVGNGVRISGSRELFLRFIERMQIPAVMHCMAKDMLPEDHPLSMGVFGTAGQRRANFAVQNADLVIALGASFSVTKVGFNYSGFAPRARKIVVNIDRGQVENQAIKADIPIVADVRCVLEELLRQTEQSTYKPSVRWTEACSIWRERYPIILKDYFADKEFVNIYVFMDRLSDMLSPGMPILAGNGFDVVSCYQAFKVKEGQRVIYSGNWGSMGWDLPLAIGVCFGLGRKPTVLATGDGSFQWNIQELLTAQYYKLPLKIFILNNQGYGSIRLTQKSLFEGRIVAADTSSGVGTVNFEKLADLYGFTYSRIPNNDAILDCARAMLATDGPALCEVMVSPDAGITPKASAFRRADGTIESRPLEDMAPFLPREEIAENMNLVAAEHVSSQKWAVAEVTAPLRAVVVGLGSIGRRHLANLRRLAPQSEIIVWRHARSEIPSDKVSDGNSIAYDLDSVLAFEPQVAILANPASHHISVASEFAARGIHLFIEKPISDSLDGVVELIAECRRQKLVLNVGYTLRFDKSLRAVQQVVKEQALGRIATIRAEVGSYLPDWRAHTDYRQSVSARKELGGGAVLELSHELDYVRWLGGEVESVDAHLATLGQLELDVEDTAEIILQMTNGSIASIHLDMIQRPPVRTCRIVGTEGTCAWDGINGRAELYTSVSGKWTNIYSANDRDLNEMYLAELEAFLACVREGKEPAVTGEDGLRILEVALAAKRSHSEQRVVRLTEKKASTK